MKLFIIKPWAANLEEEEALRSLFNCSLQVIRNKELRHSDDTHRSEDGHRLFAEPHRVEDVVVENRLKQVVLVVGLKRRLAGHHLIHQHPEGPPVHRGSVLQLLQDLTWTEMGHGFNTEEGDKNIQLVFVCK